MGAEVAPIIYDQHAECLSIDVWLDDSELLGDVKVAINKAFENWTSSNELQVVQCVQGAYLGDAQLPQSGRGGVTCQTLIYLDNEV